MNETHNHESLNQDNHTKLRQYFMTEKIKTHIVELHRKDIASKKIFFSIREKYDNENFNNFEINSKNIYNAVIKIREMKFENMIFIQILNVQLHSDSTK